MSPPRSPSSSARRRAGSPSSTPPTCTRWGARSTPWAAPMEETLRALDDVVRAGKARYVGCSNYHAYQVARALGRSEAGRLARFDSMQPRYNLLFRQVERELL